MYDPQSVRLMIEYAYRGEEVESKGRGGEIQGTN
jgi:hypothetical protein